jgi:hypothetical protein
MSSGRLLPLGPGPLNIDGVRYSEPLPSFVDFMMRLKGKISGKSEDDKVFVLLLNNTCIRNCCVLNTCLMLNKL